MQLARVRALVGSFGKRVKGSLALLPGRIRPHSVAIVFEDVEVFKSIAAIADLGVEGRRARWWDLPREGNTGRKCASKVVGYGARARFPERLWRSASIGGARGEVAVAVAGAVLRHC